MALILRIENMSTLPDGGPVSFTVQGRRNIDIGRDSHLDWTLPDPSRHISSKHCEVRYREGGYWLHDVSTNGTFLNGGDHRMQAAHRLRSGDRFSIGHYIIGATVEGEEAVAAPGAAGAPAPAASNYQELWATDGAVAPPIDRAALKPARDRQPVKADFLDWAADVPDASPAAAAFVPVPRPASMPQVDPDVWSGAPPAAQPAPQPPIAAPPRPVPMPQADPDVWSAGPPSPKPAPPPPPPVAPTPRRPVWVASEPEGPWSGDAAQSRVAGQAPAPRPPATGEPARAQPAPGQGPSSLAQRLAQGARVPEEFFADRSPEELAELLGQVMRLVVESTMQLLSARGQAKRMARSASHTMIEALNNNPLKFSPSAEDAIKIMFGPPTRSYLDAYRAFAQSYDDLKTHQIKTYGAMQQALIALMSELDPQAIEREAGESRGLGALVTSRKAKLWDAYVARWQAMSRGDSGGAIDAFMLAFAEHYDRGGNDAQ